MFKFIKFLFVAIFFLNLGFTSVFAVKRSASDAGLDQDQQQAKRMVLNEEKVCASCEQEITSDQEVITLPCSLMGHSKEDHTFHADCFDSGICPVCETRFANTEKCKSFLKSIIQNRDKIDKLDKNGLNFLHKAVLADDVIFVRFLLKCGAYVNEYNSKGLTALHLAIKKQNFAMIDFLLSHKANVNEMAVISGLTPLHMAAELDDDKITALLFQYGADSKLFTIDGLTPIHIAVKKGNLELVRFLTVSDKGLINTNYYAMPHYNGGEKIEGWNLLHLAVFYNNQKTLSHIGILNFLIVQGVNIKATRSDGMTALHIAVEKNDLKLVEWLLNRNAGINDQCFDICLDGKVYHRWTSLHIAAYKGYKEIAQRLVRYGAKLDVIDNNGQSALHIASACGHKNILELFQKIKPEDSVDLGTKKDFADQTPAMLARANGHENVSRALEEHENSFRPVSATYL